MKKGLIPIAMLTAATLLAGCQSGPTPSTASSWVRQASVSKKDLGVLKLKTGGISVRIYGNFKKADRSVLYTASDIDTLLLYAESEDGDSSKDKSKEITGGGITSPATLNVSGLSPGNYTVYIRAYSDAGKTNQIGIFQQSSVAVTAGNTTNLGASIQLDDTVVTGGGIGATVVIQDGSEVVGP